MTNTDLIKPPIKWACLIAAFVLLAASSLLVNAQTEYQIISNNENLEEEYYEELDKWMLRAYEGDRDAQFKVGVLFASDQFDKPNAEQAVYWYKQAARQGHILAQYNLGHHLLTGNGVEKNEIGAIQWWREAAKEDHALAQFNVGRAHYLGIGVEEDHEQSRYWFSRAAQNKEEKSIEVLQQLGWDDGLVTNSQPANDDQALVQTSIDEPTTAPLLPDVPLRSEQPLQSRIMITESNNTELATDLAIEASESIPATPNNIQSTESTEAPDTETDSQTKTEIVTTPVALYTDPTVRSVLITIIDHRESLNIIDTNKDWVTVRSPDGFPVWVHSDYVQVNANSATVVGSNVNARSVPIVSEGTIVGTLDGGEKLAVLDKQNDWYRVTSPSSFSAWVKTEDYNRPAVVNKSADEQSQDLPAAAAPQKIAAPQQTAGPEKTAASQQVEPQPSTPPASLNSSKPMVAINDNEWLFNQAKDSFTLQLASFDEQQKVNEFLSNSSFSDDSDLHRFTATSLDISWTYFLYGNYSDRESAESAKEELKQKNAWIRTFGRLQENRCLSWKTKLPTPSELNKYCNQ